MYYEVLNGLILVSFAIWKMEHLLLGDWGLQKVAFAWVVPFGSCCVGTLGPWSQPGDPQASSLGLAEGLRSPDMQTCLFLPLSSTGEHPCPIPLVFSPSSPASFLQREFLPSTSWFPLFTLLEMVTVLHLHYTRNGHKFKEITGELML